MRRTCLVLAAAVLALPAGCGKDGGKVTVAPVSGRILHGGKPAAGVQVYFLPTSAPTVPEIPGNPHGVTGADGRFTLTTYADGDGAAEGGYQVALFWPNEPQEGEEESTEDRLLGWYTAARSRIAVNVPAGGTNFPDWDLPVMKQPPSEEGTGVPGRN